MKKFISILLLIAVLLSCCACGASNEEKKSDLSSLDMQSPEVKFGHIDQTQPIDGFYKIWNAEGVKFMMENHPDGMFEILCSIDMEGAVLTPIQEFTGTINGSEFTVSNFTLQGGDEENFGFVSVNKGNIQSLVLKDVTFLPGSNTKNVGAIAGINEKKIQRCTAGGTMNVENVADGGSCGNVAGINSGEIANTVCNVDMTVSCAGKANVGGIAGTATGGKVEYVDANGKVTVTGSQAVTGLFAGQATDVVFNKCAFVGSDNSLDGKLFTNFTGNPDDNEREVAPKALWRDNNKEPLSENVMALRQKVVDAMYALGTVEWYVKQDVVHSCTCQLSTCHGTYNSLYVNYGTPYNHKSSSLARMKYCLGDDKVMDDWIYGLDNYDGYDIYFGTDCSSSVEQAWWTVSNSVNFWTTGYMMPAQNQGTIPVGDYVCDFKLTGSPQLTQQYIDANDEQTIYESYAKMRMGDAYTYLIKEGGHTRMCAEDAVVVRDQDGLINPEYSYVICHEQGMPTMNSDEKRYSSWRINYKYTFANLYFDTAVPMTCEELLTGEMEPVECKLEGGCDGYTGMITGTVKANYNIDSVWLNIKNADGEEILNHPMWVSTQKTEDFGGNAMNGRSLNDNYDISNFAIVLANTTLEQGESYTYTITAGLSTFDHIQVHEGSFTYGA